MSRSIEELEFERNRQEILKRSRTKTNKGQYATPVQTSWIVILVDDLLGI